MLSATVENYGDDFEPVPAGTYAARCISIIDVGTEDNTYNGKTTKRHQLMAVWEVPELMTEEGFPRTLAKYYTVSLSEKANLRKDLESWRGAAMEEGTSFDFKNLLDKPCLLSVLVTEKGKNKVAGVMKLPQGATVPPRISDLTYFDLSEFDAAVYAGLSERMQANIARSDEWAQIQGGGAAPAAKGLDGQAPYSFNPPSENPAPQPATAAADPMDDIPF